jgi:hypothetical protein
MPVAQGQTTFLSDTFESFPTGWTGASSGGVILKSAETIHGGSFSAVVNCTIASNYAYDYKTVTSTPKSDYHIDQWVFPNSSVNAVTIQLGGGYNTTNSHYNFRYALNCSGGVFYLVNALDEGLPGTWENVGSMSNNTWHHVEAYFNKTSTKIHYYIDSAKQGGDWSSLNNVFPERFYFGDTSGAAWLGKFYIDDLSIDDVSEGIPFAYPTLWATNSTTVLETWSFSSKWYTPFGSLSGYVFSSNISTSLSNETWVALSPGANDTYINVTLTITNNVGVVIQWTLYVNSSTGAWNNLISWQYATVTATLTYYWNSGGALCAASVYVANGSSVAYSVTSVALDALVDVGFNWLNMSWTYGSTTTNGYNFTVVNSTTIWVYFGSGYAQGWTDGNASGYASGYSDGYTVGYAAGYSAGYFDGNASGWIDGNATGYATGYAAGYAQGYIDGSASGGFTYAIARFEFSPSNPGNMTLILFNGSQSYYTDAISDYSWNFGDGNTTSSGAQDWIGHVYGTDGSYDVSLTVTASVSNSSAVVFHQVNVTSIVGGGGLSRTMPEDLATWVIAAFIGVMLLIAVVLIVRRRH